MKISKEKREMLLGWIKEAIDEKARLIKILELLGISLRTYKRWKKGDLEDMRKGPLTIPKNKLSQAEYKLVLEICNSKEFRNSPPSQIVPELLDRTIYVASESTIYRILKKEKMLTHRLNAKSPSNRAKPAPLIATGINQVWTWDITYLASTVRGRFFYLYLVLDIYSRKIIGAKVHEKESADLAGFFARELAFKSGVEFGKLTLHSDNGSPMKGATMLATLHELGIQPSFSRPSVSNDNPYSESMFRTLKYRPEYPDKPFETVDDAQHWVNTFVNWYNNEHRHSSLNFVTPSVRHEGDDFKELKKRAKVLEKHKQKHPERWSGEIRNCNTIGVVHLNPLKEKERNTNFLDVA